MKITPMNYNCTNQNVQKKNNQNFGAEFKLIDPENLVDNAGLIAQYVAKYAPLGNPNDKVALSMKSVQGNMDEQIQTSVAILKNDELIPFTDNINLWVYSKKEAADHHLNHLFGVISGIFKN